MRTALFALIFVLSPMTFALQARDVALTLVNGPRQINEYSGLTPKDISCQASLSIRDGKLEGFITWGDTGVAAKADLSSEAKAVSQKDGVTLQLQDVQDASTTMTLKVKGDKLLAISIDGNDPIWFIPRHFHEACGQLEQFIPAN
jgi:hypothetical protein